MKQLSLRNDLKLPNINRKFTIIVPYTNIDGPIKSCLLRFSRQKKNLGHEFLGAKEQTLAKEENTISKKWRDFLQSVTSKRKFNRSKDKHQIFLDFHQKKLPMMKHRIMYDKVFFFSFDVFLLFSKQARTMMSSVHRLWREKMVEAEEKKNHLRFLTRDLRFCFSAQPDKLECKMQG